MTLSEKIQQYSDSFESKTRKGDETYTVLKYNRAEELHESVFQAHGDRMPSDWIFATYADLMQRLTEYEINSLDDVEEYRHEIVDGYVDVYTSDITQWLADDIRNVNYITDALESGVEMREGFQLLAMAQYMAIDDIYGEIIHLLSE